MIDYLPGALHWLKRRAELLLYHLNENLERLRSSSTGRLEIIEIRLEVQVGKIKNVINEINRLLGAPNLTRPEYNEFNLVQLRQWVKNLDDIEAVYLPWAENLGPDVKAIQEFVNDICQQANFSSTIRPVVALYSSSYFYVEEHLHIIYLPRLEGHFLLHLPDLYHELAHVLLYYKAATLWDDFEGQICRHFDQAYKRGKLENSPLASGEIYADLSDFWITRWLIEYTCDLIATYLCGPAYGWAHLHLCAAKGSSPPYYPSVGEDHTHPANETRWRLIAAALDDLGWSAERKQIEKQWYSLINTLKKTEPPNFHVAYPQILLKALQKQVKDGLISLNVTLYAKSSGQQDIPRLLNQAWEMFWHSPLNYPEWESDQVKRYPLMGGGDRSSD